MNLGAACLWLVLLTFKADCRLRIISSPARHLALIAIRFKSRTGVRPSFGFCAGPRPPARQYALRNRRQSALAFQAFNYKAKQGVGSAVGSEKLKGEGAAQEVKGDAQKAVGDAKNAVKDGANKVADAVNKNL
jgi:uncharacterized protein YjbJ (UPF0337 family)